MKIRIGGVPENINIPWYVAIEEGTLSHELTWIDCPGGTGEMTRRLQDDELDVALVLTEGAIAHIANGGDARLMGTYVDSPLIWGVHVGASSPFESVDDLCGQRFAVSRMGSGSHLMSFVLAAQRSWAEWDAPQIVIAGGLDGALEKFKTEEVDGFLWEKYMTKPLVDDGTLRRVGECRAPWPAFSVAVGKRLQDHPEVISTILAEVERYVERFMGNHDAFITEIENRYGLIPDDIREWIDETVYDCSARVNREKIEQAATFLEQIGVLDQLPTFEDLTIHV